MQVQIIGIQANLQAAQKASDEVEVAALEDDLDMATKLDPLRTYPYRYRAAGN